MKKINYEHLSCRASILSCLFMSSFYVVSLYLWSKQNRYNRNSTPVIKRRFISVFITCILSLLLIYAIAQDESVSSKREYSKYISEWIGFKFDSYLFVSILNPLLLTIILFIGPLVQHLLSNYLYSEEYKMVLYEKYIKDRIKFRLTKPDKSITKSSSNSLDNKAINEATGSTSESNNNENDKLNAYSLSSGTSCDNNNNYKNGYKSEELNGNYNESSYYFNMESIKLTPYEYFTNILFYLKHSIKRLFNEKQTLTSINRNYLSDLCFWRNYFISPFTEEFVFRSCMLPLLSTHLGLFSCILITPLFFGVAHLHHIVEGLKMQDTPFRLLLAQHTFQFVYTYIFGVYSSYLFLRTGNFFSSFLCHSFCNLMGFPNINELINEFRGRPKQIVILNYFIGFLLFFALLPSYTDPLIYDNQTYLNFIKS
jgi:hypothetical protein